MKCQANYQTQTEISKTIHSKLIFTGLLLLYSLIMLYLFWMQCIDSPGFQSDMLAYVNEVAGVLDEYEFSYPLFFCVATLLAGLLGAPAAVAVTTTLFNAAALVVAKYYMDREIRRMLSPPQTADRILRSLNGPPPWTWR